jgi:hypothetical protein
MIPLVDFQKLERLSCEWYRALTPLDVLIAQYKDELRAEWSREDGVLYKFEGHICERPALRVFGRPPPVPVYESLAIDANLSIPIYTAEWNKYAAPDGRPLFMLARCRELSTIFIDGSSMIPIDYVRMGPDLAWVLQLWQRCGRHVPGMVAKGMAALQ